MRFNGVILKKFSVLDDELARLRTLGAVTVQQLETDHFLKHGVERSLQICVEIVVDVAQRILAIEGRPPAATSFDALQSLETMGILASAERYRMMIQFRNFVVHRYERVDAAILVDILRNRLGDLEAFRDEVSGAA